MCAEVEKRNLPVSFVENGEVLQLAANLLSVDPGHLEAALCTKTTLTRGETIRSPLNASTARDVCDAFVKGMYGKQFVWIVGKINRAIYQPKVCSVIVLPSYSTHTQMLTHAHTHI